MLLAQKIQRKHSKRKKIKPKIEKTSHARTVLRGDLFFLLHKWLEISIQRENNDTNDQ